MMGYPLRYPLFYFVELITKKTVQHEDKTSLSLSRETCGSCSFLPFLRKIPSSCCEFSAAAFPLASAPGKESEALPQILPPPWASVTNIFPGKG